MKIPVEIKEVGPDMLGQYAEIPIAYKVESMFRIDLIDGGLGGMRLRKEKAYPHI